MAFHRTIKSLRQCMGTHFMEKDHTDKATLTTLSLSGVGWKKGTSNAQTFAGPKCTRVCICKAEAN